MKQLLPETLKARATLIVFAVFILSHLATLLIFERNRDHTVLLTEAVDLADRIVGIVNLANSFPETERQRILAAAETQFLAMFPKTDAHAIATCAQNLLARNIGERLDHAFAAMPGVSTRVCARNLAEENAAGLTAPANSGVDVLIFVNFPDDKEAVFHAVLPEGRSLFQDSVMTSMLLAGLFALVLAWYLINKAVAPLGQLAKAADTLGANIDEPALHEGGPREVALAARAFNRMQERLARLIHGQTEMLAAISHDLRSAVTRLQLRVDLLKDDHERGGMATVVTDMRRMIQSVIDFSRGQNPSEPHRPVHIGALVESLCENLAEEGLAVHCELDDFEDIVLNCRVTDIRRALHNVIENALSYAGNARVSLEKTSEALLIVVEDDGPGVPEKELEAIARPFYRLEGSRNANTGGIGLGLTITQNVMQSHGGDLRFQKAASGGLRVELRMPRMPRR